MQVAIKKTSSESSIEPLAVEPLDKDWGVGVTSMGYALSPFERVNRLRKFALDTMRRVDAERACLVTEARKKYKNEPQVLKCAYSLAQVLQNVSIKILPDELIVGELAAPIRSAPIFPEHAFAWIVDEIKHHPWKDRPANKYYPTEGTEEKLLELESYWKGKSIDEIIASRMTEEQKKGSNLGRGLFSLNLFMYGGIGHLAPNFEKVLSLGYGGLKKQVLEKLSRLDPAKPGDLKKQEFYQAELIALDAAGDYLRRYAKLAREMAANEKDAEWKETLLKIAENCDWVSENPPRTFWEAVQLVYMTLVVIQIEANGLSVCYGRFDQYMYPFYAKDIESGAATRESIQELVEILFIKDLWWIRVKSAEMQMINAGTSGIGGDSLTVGGVDREGKDTTNDLTYMCLDAHAHTRLGVPFLAVRWHKNTPRKLKVKTVNVIRIGTGQPKIFNDQAAVPAMVRAGRTLEDARDYHVVGCVEIDVGGKEYGWHDAAYFSLAKVFELAINNGRCFACGYQCRRWDVCGAKGKRLGPETGSLGDFTSFDQVKESYDRQMKYWTDLMVQGINIMDFVHREYKPLPLLSNFIDDCTERGVDISAGGAHYNFTGPQGIGVGTVADGMATIKQLVFDEKRVSGKDLLDACEKNWEGYEPLYALVNTHKVHHYGNDDDYADELAKFATDTYFKHIEGRSNPRGGKYLPGIYTVSVNVAFGLNQWASPEGRKAFEPLSDNIGPVHTQVYPHDIKGPTAIAKSATKLDHVRAGNGTLLNWKFSPSAVAGETGRDNLISLLDTYCDRKGMHSQFNIISRDTLEDALEHPENYKDLLVRVAGYSAYFVELGRALQLDLIGRTELSFD